MSLAVGGGMWKLDGFFEVSYDRERKLMRVSTYGFWNLDVAHQFSRAIQEAARIADPACDSLVNICRTEIHTVEVNEALGRISQNMQNADTGRVAIVSPSMLLRMQTKRTQHPDCSYVYFETEQQALDWLASSPGDSVPQARAAG